MVPFLQPLRYPYFRKIDHKCSIGSGPSLKFVSLCPLFSSLYIWTLCVFLLPVRKFYTWNFGNFFNVIVMQHGYPSFPSEVAGSQKLESLFANSKYRVKIYMKKTDMSCYKIMNKHWHKHNSLFFLDTAYFKQLSIFY